MEALTTLPHLQQILTALVYLCTLAGIFLILLVPFFPGMVVMLAGILIYVGVMSFTAKAFAGMDAVILAVLVVLTIIGTTSSIWSERLGLRFTYISQQAMYGAIIGSLLGAFLFGMLGMLLGLIIGCMAMELRGGRSPKDSLQQGVSALMSMLGPRGFQLVMALVAASFVTTGKVVGL